jgi:ketosteroid isomerase-like protein
MLILGKWLYREVSLMQNAESRAAKNARRELLEVHAYERDAHYACDLDAMMLNQADSFTAVGNGGFRVLTGAEMRQLFVGAFDRATYHEFDDLEGPEIHVSDDATLAWMAVRIKVWKSQIDKEGGKQERRFVSSAIYTYENRAGRWLRTGSSGHSLEQPLE